MRLTIEPTTKFVELNGVPGRIWEGQNDEGLKVVLVVSLVQPQSIEPMDLEAFERELRPRKPPRTLGGVEMPSRMIV